jgi:HTH-type transcriptional regulator, sugar sensing transcriptional regulator
MAKRLLHELLGLGLTEGEAKVYLALSELGSSTVGPIVKRANIASSNVYDILHRLLEKGIVSYIIKQKVKYFQAAPPQTLLGFLRAKEKEIDEQKESLKKIVPQLEKLQEFVPQQKAEVFFGQKGLRSAYEKHLSRKDKKTENLFLYVHKKRFAKESDLFYFQILEMYSRVKQRGIVNESAKDTPWFKHVRKTKQVDVRYVDFPFPGQMEVCEDSVLLVAWEEKIVTILIQSADIAENFRRYFDETWKLGKK